ncbi:hypothetical protein AAG570_012854 [Ranatra chinensis]|uniref:Ionotropic glutamate receptor L-glutamate and glycine-binding domain-containing protein n=1 Tax=Ranatra chinensis TaxID=642074 RepID=A0ABD0YF77_9HEMI
MLLTAALALLPSLRSTPEDLVSFRVLAAVSDGKTAEVFLIDADDSRGLLGSLHERTAVVLRNEATEEDLLAGPPVAVVRGLEKLSELALEWPVGLVIVGEPLEAGVAACKPGQVARGAIFLFGVEPSIGALLAPSWHPMCRGSPCGPVYFDSSNYTSVVTAVLRPVRDLGGRPLKVTMFERQFTAFRNRNGILTGFDGEMVHLLTEVMNFTAQVIERSDDEQYGYKGDGTFYGSLGDLVYRRADISLNGFFAKDYGTERISFLPAVNRDRLCVTVPAALSIPDWKTVFLCFAPDVWACIIAGYLSAAVVWYALKRVIEPTEPERTATAFSVFKILLLSPLVRLPENSSERIFVLSLMISSFLLATCFQGSLLTLLTLQSYEREIRTLADLARSGLPVLTKSANLLDTFDGGDTEVMVALRSRLGVESGYTGDMLTWMLQTRKIASLGREFELKIKIGNNFSDAGGRALVHIVEECPRTYHLSYSMPRGTLLYESFNRLLALLVSSGIVRSPTLNRAHLTTGDRYTERGAYGGARPFTLENLKIAFAFLVLGFILSIVTFIVELVSKKHRG